MTLRNSWPGPTGVTSTTDARIVLAGLVEGNTSGVARAGVFPTNLSPIVTARSDMNVNIAAFQGLAVQFGGPILIANDGTMQLPAVLISPASGTNYYVVYSKQNEQTAPGTDANNLPLLGAALSTVSFAAARGTLPTGALELATVQVPAGVAATNAVGVTITQTAQFTVAEGGVLPVRNSTELSTWAPADGSLAAQIDTGVLWVRQSGAWVAASTITSGNITTIGTNWAATGTSPSPYQPRCVRQGNIVTMYGGVTSAAGFSPANILTVPSPFAPPTTSIRPIGTTVASNGSIWELFLSSGVLQVAAGYGSGAMVAGMVLPLSGLSWTMD